MALIFPTVDSKTENVTVRTAVCGLSNLFEIFLLSVGREVFPSKRSSLSDWEGNYSWLIDAATISEYLIEEVDPHNFEARSEIAAVVNLVQSASSILESSSAMSVAQRIHLSGNRLEQGASKLRSWTKRFEPNDEAVDEAVLVNFASTIREKISSRLYRPERLSVAMNSLEQSIKSLLDLIRDEQSNKEVDKSKKSTKLDDLQNVLCMNLREYALVAPVRIYFGERDEANELITEVLNAHQTAMETIDFFTTAQLSRSISNRMRFCEKMLDHGDAGRFLFDPIAFENLLREFETDKKNAA